ncbi:hypothetical protein [Pseudalkalibacillus sp. SCS-8]|uniref:hypothetical protein n=1 Tax=Pseudalkalibacillus nanhaiensis TaxID=3115291 RepID=UPI0032DA2C2C
MGIHHVIDLFSSRFEKQSHLSPFFRIQDYVVALTTDEETIAIRLRRRSCQVIDERADVFGAVEIFGCTESFESLILGRSKMSDLILQGKLKVNASYRLILKLESIFYLSSQQSRDAI